MEALYNAQKWAQKRRMVMDTDDEVLFPQVLSPSRNLLAGYPRYPLVPTQRSPMEILAESHPRTAANLMARAMDTSLLSTRVANTATIASAHTGVINTWLQTRRPDESHIRLTSRGTVHHEGFFFGRTDDVLTVQTQVDIW